MTEQEKGREPTEAEARALDDLANAREAEEQDYIAHEAFEGLRDSLQDATQAVMKAADAFKAMGSAALGAKDALDQFERAGDKVKMRPEEYGLTPEIEQRLLALATGNGERAEAGRRKRVDLCAIWRAAAVCGSLPPNPEGRNASYLKRAQRLLEIASGDCPAEERADTLQHEPIGGTNTYSRALRAYRDGLLARLGGAK